MTRTPVAETNTIQVSQPATPSVAGSSVARVLPTQPPTPANLVGSVAPVAVFLLANAAWGLVPGMLASTAAAVLATLARRRRGQQIGWLALALLGYVLIRGAAGALTGSHQVFFGISVAASITVAVAVLATSFTRTPLAAYLLPILMRGRLQPTTTANPTYRRISAHVTAVWAIAELAVSGWEAWHLQHATAVEFVGARGLIGWPVMATIIFVCAFYARFRIEWLQGPTPSHTRATTPVTP
jgi:hypothetical protein